MKRLFAVAGSLAVGLLASFLAVTPPAQAATGLHVNGTKIVESDGNQFVMRGVSHAHTWYTNRTGSFKDIKSLGANTVRVVLSSGHRWTKNDAADVSRVISLCTSNRLICVLEVHDTTGYGEQSGAITLAQAADYWVGIKSALVGHEDHIIVNIGNEPYGNNSYSGWTADTSAAIKKLRNAGLQHAIMVDAPNWGQDWAFVMRDNAKTVASADPNHNTIFSIHMYGVFDTAAEVKSYLNTFVKNNLPIVVGEFGSNHSDGDPDEDAIMATCQSLGIGYIGWSWSGNSSDVGYLDMAKDFNAKTLSDWGKRIFQGADGIQKTAKEASVFSGVVPTEDPTQTPTDTPTSTPTQTPTDTPPVDNCTAAYKVIGSWSSGFQAEVKVTAGDAALSGWTVTWTFAPGQSVASAWNAQINTSGSTVTATNVSHNAALNPGSSTSFGFIGSGSSTPVPELTCSAA
ncbi:MAG: mannan endo,4-beta-mannosidase [Actinomycetota bacterium]|nr:mannan endo,4-beta-mannosidase [Actinomycetota bacterium]